MAEECFLKKCVFFVFDPLRSKNSYRGIRLKFYRRFEMFSTLENILHRYFEHKIEKKTELFTKSSNFHVFYCSNELPSLPIGLSGSLKMACAHPRGAVKKIEVSDGSPNFFVDTLGHVLQHTRAPKELEKPPSLQST